MKDDVWKLLMNGCSVEQVMLLWLCADAYGRWLNMNEVNRWYLVEVEERNAVLEGFEYRDVLEAFRGNSFELAGEGFVVYTVGDEDVWLDGEIVEHGSDRIGEYTAVDPRGMQWSAPEQFAIDYFEAIEVDRVVLDHA